MDSAARRIKSVIRLLRKRYPQARTALEFRTPLEILVATILAAQCTDERVNRITPGLFQKYPTAAEFARAERAELEQQIRSAGFFRNKAKSIVGAARKIVEEFGGVVPDSMDKLVTLPGVARKTANIVLSAGYGRAEGIAVDTHAGRLSRRLGLSRHEDPVKVEQDLMLLLPKSVWIEFSHQMIWHGRAICSARNPKCEECPLIADCPGSRDFLPVKKLERKERSGGGK